MPAVRIVCLCGCPVVLRSDKIEIENLEPEANESEEAVEMEVSCPSFEKFPSTKRVPEH